MKKFNIFAMLLSLACASVIVSCSDDDDLKPALQSPVVTETAGAYNTLSFEWNDVPDAVQYGYRLSDTDGMAVAAGVTHDKSVTITDLQPATTYTLQVWAFASMDGDYSTPPAVTLTATTDPLIKLATPSGLALSSDNGYTYTASWNAVDNAIQYTYTVRDAEGALTEQNSISDTSVVFNNLENGEYTFSVYAEGYDGYESSSSASADFKVDKPEVVTPLYTVKGTYYSEQLGASWTAYMDAYADGTYTIRAFYGVEGYNLDFRINGSSADDMFEILNGQEVVEDVGGYDYYTWHVPTGLSDPSALVAYPWYNYSYFEGDETSGEVGIGNYWDNYDGWGYDVFTWPAEDDGVSIDDLVGSYDCHFEGIEYITDDYGNEVDWNDTFTDWATVTKVNEFTVAIDGLFLTDEPVNGTVNFDDLTITFELKPDYFTWYTFSSGDGPDVPVVGTINSDGSITVPNWCLWYNYSGEWYWYLYGTSELYPSGSAAAMRKHMPPSLMSARSTKKSAPKHIQKKRPAKKTGHKLTK